MNGPEHYLAAEHLLVDDTAQAQVHATLALAAATAMAARGSGGATVANDNGTPAGMHPSDYAAWDLVSGVPAAGLETTR